jgi:hypothetical protein
VASSRLFGLRQNTFHLFAPKGTHGMGLDVAESGTEFAATYSRKLSGSLKALTLNPSDSSNRPTDLSTVKFRHLTRVPLHPPNSLTPSVNACRCRQPPGAHSALDRGRSCRASAAAGTAGMWPGVGPRKTVPGPCRERGSRLPSSCSSRRGMAWCRRRATRQPSRTTPRARVERVGAIFNKHVDLAVV